MREVSPNKGLDSTHLEDAGIADRLSQSALHRRTMVDCQIRTFDVTDQQLLARMLEVPREHFLSGELARLAYSDIGLQLKPAGIWRRTAHALAAACSRAPHPRGRRGIDRHQLAIRRRSSPVSRGV
jgi:hypothetical protein